MKIMQKLGLVGLLAAAGCGGEEALVQITPRVQMHNLCQIRPTTFDPSKAKMPDFQPETHAVDTDGDGVYDEAFVTKGYVNVNIGIFQFDNRIVRATTHYVAPGLGPDKQYLTGFPETKPMTPEYQAALGLVCRGRLVCRGQ